VEGFVPTDKIAVEMYEMLKTIGLKKIIAVEVHHCP
jgi:ribonuclease Z